MRRKRHSIDALRGALGPMGTSTVPLQRLRSGNSSTTSWSQSSTISSRMPRPLRARRRPRRSSPTLVQRGARRRMGPHARCRHARRRDRIFSLLGRQPRRTSRLGEYGHRVKRAQSLHVCLHPRRSRTPPLARQRAPRHQGWCTRRLANGADNVWWPLATSEAGKQACDALRNFWKASGASIFVGHFSGHLNVRTVSCATREPN